MAQPQGEVFVFIGDGTYLMNPTELVTASQEGLKITLVISENHGFQCIRQLQMGRAGHSFGNEFRARDSKSKRLEGDFVRIDFAKNAESMGARTWSATTPEEVRQALREAREEKCTSVIVVQTEKYRFLPGSGVWWDVAPAEVSQDPVTRKLRAEYEEGRRKLQRFHY
jgi:3D-(3,5/4)-trihydroxycyclohexane-1,2-dione acylhydrolase (decyclizing)